MVGEEIILMVEEKEGLEKNIQLGLNIRVGRGKTTSLRWRNDKITCLQEIPGKFIVYTILPEQNICDTWHFPESMIDPVFDFFYEVSGFGKMWPHRR